MKREIIATAGAPKAAGTYSQAVRAGDSVYVSGQVPLDPATGQLVSDDIELQIRRVFDNLKAIAEAAGCSLNDAVRFTVFLIDLAHFPVVNQVMTEYLREPYPTRSTVGIASLPRGARVEIDCILHRPS
ncbi:MAG TPA: RidA family protein [Steroidobacteraceae bacterium]|nr:RidA family protein [Steroidobacteraceae bacterium]